MMLADSNGSIRITPVQALPSGDGVIELEVRMPQGTWATDDPGLERNDLRSLARWMRSLGKGRTAKELGFAEFNLRFECLAYEEPLQIRVWFEGEARPEWAPYRTWDEEDLWLDLSVSRTELASAAETLTNELHRVEARP